MTWTKNRCYELIREHYADHRAERSGVPLINHIDEGLRVLTAIGASPAAHSAFCIHPLLQAGEDLLSHLSGVSHQVPPYVLALAMEYRSRANAALSDRVVRMASGPAWVGDPPSAGPLAEVRHMLIADKVQNYKDFCAYHYASHPRSGELSCYFGAWLKALGIDGAEYLRLAAAAVEAP